jgi:hypothetical protein
MGEGGVGVWCWVVGTVSVGAWVCGGVGCGSVMVWPHVGAGQGWQRYKTQLIKPRVLSFKTRVLLLMGFFKDSFCFFSNVNFWVNLLGQILVDFGSILGRFWIKFR